MSRKPGQAWRVVSSRGGDTCRSRDDFSSERLYGYNRDDGGNILYLMHNRTRYGLTQELSTWLTHGPIGALTLVFCGNVYFSPFLA